ncbi:hypothetical protein HK100_002288 [Physocladia obscura]|uniref:Uncharacterized protein n=1 Tax=Physocladia obscura TaxID=109957 RepID=A0AAD5T8C0_9FUNG|nr:hypothetical protein HK100_002288 [Physocladia obscura]
MQPTYPPPSNLQAVYGGAFRPQQQSPHSTRQKQNTKKNEGWRNLNKYNSRSGRPAYSTYESMHGPIIWRVVNGLLPIDAIQLGRDSDGAPIYAARAPLHGGWHIGKCRNAHSANISYGGNEVQIHNSFEILCGPPTSIVTVPQSGHLDLVGLATQPLEGGYEANGERLFVALAERIDGSLQVGKCGPAMNGCDYGYGGREETTFSYRVVCVAAASGIVFGGAPFSPPSNPPPPLSRGFGGDGYALTDARYGGTVITGSQPAFSHYGPVFWETVIDRQLPFSPVQLGRDSDGAPLFAARAAMHGGWHVGKCRNGREAFISYGGAEQIVHGDFQVLCGSPNAIVAIPQSGHLNIAALPMQPLESGHEENGERLYIGLVNFEGGVQVGKCSIAINGCNFGYDGREESSHHYSVVSLR